MLKILLKKLDKILDLMLEEREERKRIRLEEEQLRKDKELLEYLEQKRKDIPPVPSHSSINNEERVRTKANILIPANLSSEERMILEDFYNDK